MMLRAKQQQIKTPPRDVVMHISPARLLRLFTPPVAARILALLERDDRDRAGQQRGPQS